MVWIVQTKLLKSHIMFQVNYRLFLQLISQTIPASEVPRPPEEITPAPVLRSSRQTKPPVRYRDPTSLPDDIKISDDIW